MANERVRRTQELRRSSAASPRPGRRRGGPAPEEWDEAPSDDPYCAAHGVRFDPAVGCPDCVPELTDVLREAIERQRG